MEKCKAIPHSVVSSNKVNLAEWDDLAVRMDGGVHHCSDYTLYEADVTKSEPLFVTVTGANEQCMGIAAGTLGISQLWPFSRYCRLAMFPSLPVVGSADPNTASLVLAAIENHLSRKGVHEIRFASYDSPLSCDVLAGLNYQTDERNEYHIDLTLDRDDLLGALHANRRKQVRKAEKRGIQTRLENTKVGLELVDQFRVLSMRRRGIPVRPASPQKLAAQGELLVNGRMQIFVSYLGDEPVNANSFGYFNGRAYGLLSGSSDIGNKCYGPVHLTWTAIDWFKREGATQLSIGGAKKDEQGLRTFKLEFGTIEQPQPTGRKSVSRIGSLLAACKQMVRRR
jgi:hypothetical protein